MKKSLILLFILGSILQVRAQVSFKIFIDSLNSGFATSIRECTDGGYVFCGGNLNGEAIAGKLDAVGNIEWIRSYMDTGIFDFRKIRQHPSGGYLAIGNMSIGNDVLMKLYRLNQHGDSLWSRYFNLSNIGWIPGAALEIMSDGNYAIAGLADPGTGENPYLIITDSLGNMIYNRIYQVSGRFNAMCIKDNTLAMTGTLYNQNQPGVLEYLLFGADSVCDSLWSNTVSTSMQQYGTAIVPTSGGYISCGVRDNQNVFLVNSDTIGNINWTKIHQTGNRPINANDITTTSDGGFAMVGTTYHVNILDFDLILIKTDSAGDTLWTRKFNEGSDEGGNSLMQTSDGGYILAGHAHGNEIYIIKTDSMGNVSSTVGVNELSASNLRVYPNPSAGIISITSDLPVNEEALISVSDVKGRVVHSEKLMSASQLKLDLAHLNNGIYFLRMSAKGKVSAGKIVIRK